jgi:hypothetical protein
VKIYGLTLDEGSNIENFTAKSGTSFPANGNDGELFYLTSGDAGFYAYAQSNWHKIVTKPLTERTQITGNTTLVGSETYIGVRHSADITITLPTGIDGQFLIIKDELGVAATHSITITPASGQNIETQSYWVIGANFGVERLVFGAGNWSRV